MWFLQIDAQKTKIIWVNFQINSEIDFKYFVNYAL